MYFSVRPPESLENLTATSPSTIAPVSTSLLSFDGTIASTYHNTRPSSAGNDRKLNRRSNSCGDEPDRTSRSQCGQASRNLQSQPINKGTSKQGSSSSPSSQVVKSVFVQGIGWASQVSSRMIIKLISRYNTCTLPSRHVMRIHEHISQRKPSLFPWSPLVEIATTRQMGTPAIEKLTSQ